MIGFTFLVVAAVLISVTSSFAVKAVKPKDAPKLIKNDPLELLSKTFHSVKNIRAITKDTKDFTKKLATQTINRVLYYEGKVYMAQGFYTDTCLCGESSTGTQCQEYKVGTEKDGLIPVVINIFNTTDCSGFATVTYRIPAPSSGTSTVESDCDAGSDTFDLPYKLEVGGPNYYEKFGSGELNFIYGHKEDCSSNSFTSYFFAANRVCAYGPEDVCKENNTWEAVDKFSVRVTVYTDNQCENVAGSYTYSFEDQQCQAMSDGDQSALSEYNTVMFQGF